MKGREMASTVRMNQDGWTMIKDFRFFRNLRGKAETARWAPGAGPGEGSAASSALPGSTTMLQGEGRVSES